MRLSIYVLGTCLALFVAANAKADTLYDNGPTDGSGGVSNVQRSVFGAERAVLDDFVIPEGEHWEIIDFHWTHTWNTLPVGSGTGLNLEFWSDNGGVPGGSIAAANVTSYEEVATGNVFFSRPEAESSVEFDPIVLGPGTYWFRGFVIGPENNFWLSNSTTINGSEGWVDFEDFDGLQSTIDIFGVARDFNFVITGIVLPIPESNAISLVAAGLVGLIARRRRTIFVSFSLITS